MSLRLWVKTPANNDSISGSIGTINWKEGQAPSTVNDTARIMMGEIREWYEDPQWVDFGDTPSMVNQTTISISGSVTATYHIGRRIKMRGGATRYGTITDVTFSAGTQVTVTVDSGSLSASLSQVALGPPVASTPVGSASQVALKGQILQSAVLEITNTGGTMQHRFISEIIGTGGASNFVARITAASATLGNTPTGADATTAFATGGKIGSANTNSFIIDSIAAQVAADTIAIASIENNDSSTAVTCAIAFVSRNVNGVTRIRPEFYFYKASDGSSFALTTANIAAGKVVRARFLMMLA